MAKKKNNQFGWPFAKWRMTWISEGDRLIAEADEILGDPALRGLPGQAARNRRAARLYEKSARFYRQAGLGLMAQGSWQDAAECYAFLADADNCERCERKANAIPEYFSEEVE